MKYTLQILATFAAMLAIMVPAWLYITTPEVVMSYPDGGCIQVIPESAGSCDDLPTHYTVVYHWKSPDLSRAIVLER